MASSGKGSREKGSRAERELAWIFTDHGYDFTRNIEGSRGQDTGDLDNDLGLYVEVRRRENQSIHKWLLEVADKKGDRIGVLATRRNHEPWRFHLDQESFFRLMALQAPKTCHCSRGDACTDCGNW